MDGATSMKRRVDFAKVCVIIPLDFDFPSSMKLKIHGKHVFVDVEYPWKPPTCSRCCRFGHPTARCPGAPSQVWVPRTSLIREQNPSDAAPVARPSSQNVESLNNCAPTVSDIISTIHEAVVTRESPSTARTSAQPPSSLLDAVVSRESPSTANPSETALADCPSTQVTINRVYTAPVGPEEMSATNGAVVTRDSSSSARMSARSPTSLVGVVVSRESLSTAMAIVGSPFSPPLSRPSQSLTRYSKDSASSLGPLLATPNIPRLLRTADDSSLNNLTGNSFSMRNSGSPTYPRVSAQPSGNPRGKEVVVFSTHEQPQSILEHEEGAVSAEDLFQFNVDNNAYAALVNEEDGIDEDISETHEEPFDDHIVDPPQVTRLNMPSQVVTRAQLQQQHLQNSGKRGRGRAKGSGNKGKNKR
ncbi:hypothetical protein IFM89_012941 [Coptis chinensis]|uniref:DUF4283 domain-containing protein n=1 Tax=Coptis chinensis TaxID=261450 RepID=A0A835HE85_9MAGN|nr:hypothetical protein IFM89_012941 [Coptis chinensis]